MEQQQLEFNKNEDNMRRLVSAMKMKLAVIEQGGGKKSLEKLRQRGKLTARERIAALIDKGSR
ncbi:MAG: acyl-CoA carboxylase subunit beta, partial [Chitinophaga sp.]